MAEVWMDVVEAEREGRVGSAGGGGGGGGIVHFLARRLGGREDFGCEREEVERVERKRPSSSSMGVGGLGDLPLFSDDFEICESAAKRFPRGLGERADVRPNMSSAFIGWVSRSESASKSKSGGTKDFLRKGEGVSVCEVYWRKGRGEGIVGLW